MKPVLERERERERERWIHQGGGHWAYHRALVVWRAGRAAELLMKVPASIEEAKSREENQSALPPCAPVLLLWAGRPSSAPPHYNDPGRRVVDWPPTLVFAATGCRKSFVVVVVVCCHRL